jgi:16S rRNA processing protein RimM
VSEARHLPKTVVVGRIGRPHGVRGEVTVEVLTDVAERFAAGQPLRLSGLRGASRGVVVATSRLQGKVLVLRLEGCDDRDQAEALRGGLLEVASSDVPAAPEGAWYHYQLVGCRVVDQAAGELGPVVEVIEDGGGVLLEIQTAEGRLLLPFVEAYLIKLDVAGGLIQTDVPGELIETCISTS